MLAPARALADQLDLGGALSHHHGLDERCERRDERACDRAERGAPVAEDPGVAVVVRGERAGDSEVGEDAREDRHRVLDSRILGIRLDPLECRLSARALDLELGHEDDMLAGHALGEDHRPLVREEVETGEIADRVLLEENVAGETRGADVIEHPVAAGRELG